MDGDCDHGAGLDLGHATGCELVLSLLANVNVTGQLSPAAAIDNVLLDLRITDDGSILLARRNGGAVASKSRVNQEALARALVTNRREDGGVGVNSGEECGKRKGSSRVTHVDWIE